MDYEQTKYEKSALLALAKRFQNDRRGYLLVNPLQAKHIPVSPAASMQMMESLGNRLYARFPQTRLVIGFAETATAIGAMAAERFGENCFYLQTTRENPDGAQNWLHFQEEHSHATDQKLCVDRLREWIDASPQVILVDDELSTGKTMRNLAARLRQAFPSLRRKQLIAASIINRLSEENLERLRESGIAWEALLKLPEEDYEQAVRHFQTAAPLDRRAAVCPSARVEIHTVDFGDANPRLGVSARQHRAACEAALRRILPLLQTRLKPRGRVLVLGTEEFMYLPLLLARALQTEGNDARCHATTRSPIGVCAAAGYPIFNGYQIPSFYEPGRDTYLYNLAPYDTVIVLTDSQRCSQAAISALAAALHEHGRPELLLLCGGTDV